MAAINLPTDFLLEMEHFMESEEEYRAFLESYQKERAFGLRRNPLRYNKEEFDRLEEEGQVNLRDLDWEDENSTFPLYYEDYAVNTPADAVNAYYADGFPKEYVIQDVVPITKVDMSKYKEIKKRGRKR